MKPQSIKVRIVRVLKNRSVRMRYMVYMSCTDLALKLHKSPAYIWQYVNRMVKQGVLLKRSAPGCTVDYRLAEDIPDVYSYN